MLLGEPGNTSGHRPSAVDPALRPVAATVCRPDRRRRDGSRSQLLRHVRRLARVLLARGIHGRSGLHRNLRPAFRPRARVRRASRHRAPVDQHPPRCRRGRRARAHLPAAGRPAAIRLHQRGPARRDAHRGRPSTPGIPTAAGGGVPTPRPRSCSRGSTDERWSRPKSWGESTARRSTASSGRATTSSHSASVCPARAGSPSPPTRGCGPGSAAMSRPDVIVIGAGFAGLSAAVRLVQAGARVLVVEERRRLGGRATAFADPQTGEIVDNGQHALFGCYRETFAFLRAIDAYRNVALDERLDIEVIDRDFVRSRLVTPQWAPPLHLVGGLLRWSALGLRDRAAALRMGLVLRRLARRDDQATWTRLGGQTAEAWLIECGQTLRLRELLWEPLVVAALNQSPATARGCPLCAGADAHVQWHAVRCGDRAAASAAGRAVRGAGAAVARGTWVVGSCGHRRDACGRWRSRRGGRSARPTRRGGRGCLICALVLVSGARAGHRGSGADCRRRGPDGRLADCDRQSLVRPHGDTIRRLSACRAAPSSGCSTRGVFSARRLRTCRLCRAAPSGRLR